MRVDPFSTIFNWEFEDFGLEYTSFKNGSLNGGFYLSKQACVTENGSALIVFYSDNLLQTQSKIISAGGVISKSIFEFPGGCRFHFMDTTGNEFAVWSDQG